MENEKVKEALISFGLSKKEVEVYLTILRFGMATASEISDISNINRSTVYDILRSFISKGIASKTLKGTTSYFEVASPEKLISSLEEKRDKIKEVLGELKEIQEKPLRKPIVKVFQGKEGVKTVLNDILSTKADTDAIATSKIFEVLAYSFPNYILNRKERGIKARVIQEASKNTRDLKKRDKQELRKTRAIENLNLNSVTFIYGDKVAIIKLVKGELVCVNIIDKTISDDKREMFELLWKIAK